MRNTAFIFFIIFSFFISPNISFAEEELDIFEDIETVSEDSDEDIDLDIELGPEHVLDARKISIFEEDGSYKEMENMVDGYQKEIAMEQRGGKEPYFFDCDSPEFKEKITEAVIKYQEANPKKTILGKRSHRLLLKEIEKMKDVSLEDLRVIVDVLASKVIKLKINEKLRDEDIKSCMISSGGYRGGSVYVLLYKKNHYVNVEIINLAYSGNLEALKFKY